MPTDEDYKKFLESILNSETPQETKPQKFKNLSDCTDITYVKPASEMDGTEGDDIIGDDTSINLFDL